MIPTLPSLILKGFVLAGCWTGPSSSGKTRAASAIADEYKAAGFAIEIVEYESIRTVFLFVKAPSP